MKYKNNSEKKLIKQNRLLLLRYKTVFIIGDIPEEKHILYKTLKSLKVKCAYLTPHFLSYNKKSFYFKNFNKHTLNNILLKLKSESIPTLIINIPNELIPMFSKYTSNHCLLINYNDKDKKYFKQLKPIYKHSITTLYYFKYNSLLKNKLNCITIGENADFIINNYIIKKKKTIVEFEYRYNKYSISINSKNKQTIEKQLVTMIACVNMGYDILDVIDIINNYNIKD